MGEPKQTHPLGNLSNGYIPKEVKELGYADSCFSYTCSPNSRHALTLLLSESTAPTASAMHFSPSALLQPVLKCIHQQRALCSHIWASAPSKRVEDVLLRRLGFEGSVSLEFTLASPPALPQGNSSPEELPMSVQSSKWSKGHIHSLSPLCKPQNKDSSLTKLFRNKPEKPLVQPWLSKLQSHQQPSLFYDSVTTTATCRLQDTGPGTVLRTLDFPQQHPSKGSLSHVTD